MHDCVSFGQVFGIGYEEEGGGCDILHVGVTHLEKKTTCKDLKSQLEQS